MPGSASIRAKVTGMHCMGSNPLLASQLHRFEDSEPRENRRPKRSNTQKACCVKLIMWFEEGCHRPVSLKHNASYSTVRTEASHEVWAVRHQTCYIAFCHVLKKMSQAWYSIARVVIKHKTIGSRSGENRDSWCCSRVHSASKIDMSGFQGRWEFSSQGIHS